VPTILPFDNPAPATPAVPAPQFNTQSSGS
jgi:hypothetical protein